MPLVNLRHQRLGKRQSVPCSGIPDRLMRVESFSAGGVVIFNSLSASGFERWFCTWSEQLGTVSGKSLQYPWLRLKGVGAEIDVAPDLHLKVIRRRGRVEVAGEDGTALILRTVGVKNIVQLERATGIVLARFPPLGRPIEVDLEELSGPEKTLLLATFGAGLVRRARRLGIISRSLLPSAID